MSEIDDGGPAFPYDVQRNGRGHHDGMTLRDWFAGQALAGLIGSNPYELAAQFAYKSADAMLAARKNRSAP